MTALDAADLVVIAGRTIGIGTDAALARMDIPAAQAALAEARPPEQEPGAAFPDRAAAAAAGVGLVHALLRHRPFPQQSKQVAVAAGLQFLSLNGWQADLDPAATTAVVVEALASGRLTPGDAATWLSPRLSAAPRPYRARPAPAAAPRLRPLPRLLPAAPAPAGRAAASALLAVAVGGAAVFAAGCSRAPDTPAAAAVSARAAVQSPASARPADLAYAACMRSHGIKGFPDPSASGVAAIVPTAGIDPDSLQFRSADRNCQAVAPTAVVRTRIITTGTGPTSPAGSGRLTRTPN